MDKELLRALCALDGVSGRENAVRNFVLQKLQSSSAPHEITVDAMGNVMVHLVGRQTGSCRVLLDAHMDEIGFLITHISENGSLGFDTVGGIDKQVLFGCRVRIGQHQGVIGGKAIHHCQGDEKITIPAVDMMEIDIGASSREEAEKMVQLGDWGTFSRELSWQGSTRFTGKAVDDRVGCALLLGLAQQQPPYDLWLSFSVQEEVGLRGAGVVANAVKPDVAIALDATTAADTVGSSRETAVCRVGDGAVVSFADRATVYDAELYRQIWQLAEQNAIPIQTKNRVAGGNNAGAIQRAANGTRMAAISLPCRYIHSDACTGDWRDIEAMERLLRCLIESLPV